MVKEDRNLILKDLDALKMNYMRQNVAKSVRKCYHHKVLKTEVLKLLRMQELNKEVKHRRFLSWMSSCVYSRCIVSIKLYKLFEIFLYIALN